MTCMTSSSNVWCLGPAIETCWLPVELILCCTCEHWFLVWHLRACSTSTNIPTPDSASCATLLCNVSINKVLISIRLTAGATRMQCVRKWCTWNGKWPETWLHLGSWVAKPCKCISSCCLSQDRRWNHMLHHGRGAEPLAVMASEVLGSSAGRF